MILISPLASGYADAPGGFARIYNRGTTTDATAYTDFEGTVTTTTHTLNSAGRAKRFVNALVDVYVYDSAGVLVDDFTFASGAQSTELIHAHVTGTDYDTGAVGLAKPTTMQAVVDKLYASFGADDFNVIVAGMATPLGTALGASRNNGIFDVLNSAYGALGDGITDDTVAINLAIAAAAAATNGGTVLFPPGNYRITNKLDLSITGGHKVALAGAGPALSILNMDHNTRSWILAGAASAPTGWQAITGLRFAAAQSTSGYNVESNNTNFTRYRFKDCYFGNSTGTHVGVNASAQLEFLNCRWNLTGTVSAAGAATRIMVGTFSTENVKIIDNEFDGPTAAWSPAAALIYGCEVQMRGCRFNFGSTTGTGTIIDQANATTTTSSRIIGNSFVGGASTWTAMSVPNTLAGTDQTFIEDDNIFTTLAPYSTSPGTVLYSGYWKLGSRASRQVTSTAAVGTTVQANFRDYGGYTFVYTGTNAAQTIDFQGTAVGAQGLSTNGAWFYIRVVNTASVTVNVTFTSTNITLKGTPVNPTTNTTVIFAFRYDGARWTQQGAGLIVAN